MPDGLIVKALSGYYYVLPQDSGEHVVQCRARGIFKKKGITPLVGDFVTYTLTENGEGTVDEIKPRRTELARPPVANVELALLIFAVAEPELSLQLLDKFLVHTEHAGLETAICFTKTDLLNEPEREDLSRRLDEWEELYRRIGYTVLRCSARTGEGTDAVRSLLAGRITVFAGQSGVGKSSLLNRMIPGLELATSEISSKLGRGRHTTRHVELIAHPEGGWIADTPGFSQLDFAGIEAEDLGACFAEIGREASRCKFRGCLHRSEPECAVVAGVESGLVRRSRYAHYLQFLQEIMDKKRRY